MGKTITARMRAALTASMTTGGQFLLVSLILVWSVPAPGQNAAESELAGDRLRIVAAEGRELVALPPYSGGPDVAQALPVSVGGLVVQSYEMASRRMHVVIFEGETFRASTPMDGSRSWLAFDPARRAFAALSPSLRIELNEGVDLDAVADAVGATGIAVFDSLGFAVVGLPEGLHPADAESLVRNLSGSPDAAVRLRAPQIQWR